MKVGNFITIPAFKKHRGNSTPPDGPAVWPGVSYNVDPEAAGL